MNPPYIGFTPSPRAMPAPAPSIRLVVVDDHPIMREGLVAALSAQGGIAIVAEAGDADAAVDANMRHRPDVAVIDLQMPRRDGLDAIRAIRGIDREARLIVLTTYRGDARIASALEHGARAYRHKNAPPRELAAMSCPRHSGRKSPISTPGMH